MTALAPAAPIAAIRYMGNKKALAERIASLVADVAPGGSLVVDPMAGSHAVTQVLKRRHRLVASDAQEYSAVLGRAFVDNVTVRRVEPAVLEALEVAARGRLASRRAGFLERSFADTYLGAAQCRDLDALRGAVDDVLPDGEDPRRALALAALCTAACRAQASPGHFAQFLPPDHRRTRALRGIDVRAAALGALASWDVAPGHAGSRTFALPWARLIAAHEGTLAEAAAWYLDPPYTSDQYSRFYHLLETLVRGDEPELRHRARYRTDRFGSAFCSRRNADAELRALLGAIRRASPRAAVVLSYSARGLLSREAILASAEAAGFREDHASELSLSHSTQGKGVLRGVREWLFRFRPVN